MKRFLVIAALTTLAFALFNTSSVDAGLSRKFQRGLLKKAIANFEDGGRVAYYLKTGDKFAGDFDALQKALVENGLISENWDYSADKNLERGIVSYMIYQALDINGGLTLRVFGPSQRYCYRECVYLELVPFGNQRRSISGAELLGIFDRCSRWKQEHNNN